MSCPLGNVLPDQTMGETEEVLSHCIKILPTTCHINVMMMVLCPKAGSLAFTQPGDEMSKVVSRCLPHRQ